MTNTYRLSWRLKGFGKETIRRANVIYHHIEQVNDLVMLRYTTLEHKYHLFGKMREYDRTVYFSKYELVGIAVVYRGKDAREEIITK